MNAFSSAAARGFATAVVSLAIGLPAGAAVCTQVTFALDNVTDGPILITQVGYRDLNSSNPSQRITEGLPGNMVCPAHTTCWLPPQDLGSITSPRRNHNLTDIQYRHSHEDKFGDWMTAVWSSKNTPDTKKCTNGRTYGPYDVN